MDIIYLYCFFSICIGYLLGIADTRLKRSEKEPVTINKVEQDQKKDLRQKFPTEFSSQSKKMRNSTYRKYHNNCSRAFAIWTRQEDIALLKNSETMSVNELSKYHQRSECSISMRLNKLGY